MSEKAADKIISRLVARFKPESVSVAKADIIGYYFDEKTKTLHLLSQKDADIFTSKGKQWAKINDIEVMCEVCGIHPATTTIKDGRWQGKQVCRICKRNYEIAD